MPVADFCGDTDRARHRPPFGASSASRPRRTTTTLRAGRHARCSDEAPPQHPGVGSSFRSRATEQSVRDGTEDDGPLSVRAFRLGSAATANRAGSHFALFAARTDFSCRLNGTVTRKKVWPGVYTGPLLRAPAASLSGNSIWVKQPPCRIAFDGGHDADGRQQNGGCPAT
jgi:hypothetical protein